MKPGTKNMNSLKRALFAAIAAAATSVSTPALGEQEVMMCHAGGGIGPRPVVDAKSVLVGETVQIYAYDAEKYKGTRKPELMTEAFTRTFTERSVTESFRGESVTYDITFEGAFWCRFDEPTGKKACFGIAFNAVGKTDRHFYEFQQQKDGFCKGIVVGRIEGRKITPDLVPQRPAGNRRARA
jgi:hypothetical protein